MDVNPGIKYIRLDLKAKSGIVRMVSCLSVKFNDLTRTKLKQSTCDPKIPFLHHSEIKRQALYDIKIQLANISRIAEAVDLHKDPVNKSE